MFALRRASNEFYILLDVLFCLENNTKIGSVQEQFRET